MRGGVPSCVNADSTQQESNARLIRGDENKKKKETTYTKCEDAIKKAIKKLPDDHGIFDLKQQTACSIIHLNNFDDSKGLYELSADHLLKHKKYNTLRSFIESYTKGDWSHIPVDDIQNTLKIFYDTYDTKLKPHEKTGHKQP